jgi:hypothetical protein
MVGRSLALPPRREVIFMELAHGAGRLVPEDSLGDATPTRRTAAA